MPKRREPTSGSDRARVLAAFRRLMAADRALTTPGALVDAFERRHRWHRESAHLTRAELLRIAREALT
jgi:hypothetical protein